MNKTDITFVTSKNITLHFTQTKTAAPRKQLTIVYFHGGGLFCGSRHDLPEPYQQLLVQAGFDLLALDYPFAPECSLREIHASVQESMRFLFAENLIPAGERYALFGRSAGGYLSFMTCSWLLETKLPQPAALISLYGYAQLTDPAFHTPDKYYLSLGKISAESCQKLLRSAPITESPIEERLCLYIRARQEGSWIDTLCQGEDPARFGVLESQYPLFPPVYMAACTMDPDVPYRISKQLKRKLPHAVLTTLYESSHDFDRDLTQKTGEAVYQEIIAFLSSLSN